MKIAIAGTGYVGLSLATLLSIKNEVVAYDIVSSEDNFFNSRVIRDLDEFKKISDVIIVNRVDDNVKDVLDKIYTRDIFTRD